MDERTGIISFINSHDYVSDITGEEWRGCLAALKHDSGTTLLYTQSTRLQNTLEMAYLSKARVTVSFWAESENAVADIRGVTELSEMLTSTFSAMDSSEGPLNMKAIWTRV